MKEYTGLQAVGDSKAIVTVRTNGIKSPTILAKHFVGEFIWGIEDKGIDELAKSLLLDAFNITHCPTKKCKCESKWVTQEHIEALVEKFLMDFITDKSFKITQDIICDMVFDINNMYNQIEKEIDEIKVPEVV